MKNYKDIMEVMAHSLQVIKAHDHLKYGIRMEKELILFQEIGKIFKDYKINTSIKIPGIKQYIAQQDKFQTPVNPSAHLQPNKKKSQITPPPLSKSKKDRSRNRALSLKKPKKLQIPKLMTKKPVKISAKENQKLKSQNQEEFKTYKDLAHIVTSQLSTRWFPEPAPPGEFPPQSHLPVKYLTSTVFWFLVNANYFPKLLILLIKPEFLTNKIKNHIREQLGKTGFINKFRKEDILKYLKISEDLEEDIELEKQIADLVESKDFKFNKIQKNSQKSYNFTFDAFILENRKMILDLYNEFLFSKEDKPIEIIKRMNKLKISSIVKMQKNKKSIIRKNIHKQLKNIQNKIEFEQKSQKKLYSPDTIDINDILLDINQITRPEKQYMDYLESQQQNDISYPKFIIKNTGSVGRTVKLSKKIEEVCQICNDGDFQEDNKIVFCSKCNISVHQICYGIPILPDGDWTCQLCQEFKISGQFMRCVFCTRRGGALKPTKIPVNSDQNIFRKYNSPAYMQWSEKCPKEEKIKEEVKKEGTSEKKKYDLQQTPEKDFVQSFKEKLNYEYSNVQKASLCSDAEILENEPLPYYVWCHMTCVYWLPELNFKDDYFCKGLKGIKFLNKRRFQLKCIICNTKGTGACIQCFKGKCKAAFHPECARRAGLLLEVKNETNEQGHYIYCEKHRPLKIRWVLESKEKKYKEEIKRFCKALQKLNAFGKVQKPAVKQREQAIQKPVQPEENSLLPDRFVIKREEENKFLRLVRNYFYVNDPMTIWRIQIRNSKNVNSQQGYQYINSQKPEHLALRLNIQENDLVWFNIKYRGRTPNQLYRKYRKIIKLRKAEYDYLHGYPTNYLTMQNGKKSVRREEKKKAMLQKKLVMCQKQAKGITLIMPSVKPQGNISYVII